jgi:hypothetical protein
MHVSSCFFGQKFKDNGYQLMNDRDAPIWQNPGYWPVTFRITPIWHRISTGKVAVDQGTGVTRITTSGFDLSGLDFHTGGTLEKNISFYVLPSSNNAASFHFETVMARLDNLFGSPWLNLKLGKFELDNLLSEKRILTLTGNGGIYQTKAGATTMATAETHKNSGLGKELIVYVCLLALAGMQCVIAYQEISASQRLV